MSNYSKQIEVGSNDHVAQDRSTTKWCVPLKDEGVFLTFMANKGNHIPVVHQVLGGDGSLFSPFLFGKFFDPSDAFPLWEFEPGELLSTQYQQISGMTSGSNLMVDWFQTNMHYVLKAQLPAILVENNNLQIDVENGEVLEISSQWRRQAGDQSKAEDWKSSHWWEHGFVRRLELPENVDWKKIEAYVKDDMVLEIKMPKIIKLVIPN